VSTTDQHLFWIASRAAGTAALLLASLAVGVGLLMGGRLVKRKGADLRVVHEALSLATMTAIAIHALVLLGDQFLRPSLADLTIPFVGSFARGWTTLGIVSGWAFVVLGLSYYARGRIGAQRWRTLHRFTALAWLGGLAHSIGEGTDAGQVWFLASVGAVALPVLVLLVVRTFGGRAARPSGRPRPAAPSPRPRISQS
jgi:sulfoxide reductase heme-binding subunit YedZ